MKGKSILSFICAVLTSVAMLLPVSVTVADASDSTDSMWPPARPVAPKLPNRRPSSSGNC
ncbi:hypothetical protein BHAP_1752 [Bifidobacterium hapali]|uniref:Uncharacterized protein n=1 Tax=Bifidobacterium hapali TaxID=1630172 RepID=A0A261FY13_9BIFI|nr:hypothetical protein BHAP_1752 [Bifidobacterium hapali]